LERGADILGRSDATAIGIVEGDQLIGSRRIGTAMAALDLLSNLANSA
jgi:hypothetical protein